jgi:hypothetical protein
MPHTDVLPEEKIERDTRRYNRYALATVSTGLGIFVAASAMLVMNGPLFWITALANTLVVALLLMASFPSRGRRIADRLRWESPQSYVRRQRFRIGCYGGFFITALLTLIQMYAHAAHAFPYPSVFVVTVVASILFIVLPDCIRPYRKGGNA